MAWSIHPRRIIVTAREGKSHSECTARYRRTRIGWPICQEPIGASARRASIRTIRATRRIDSDEGKRIDSHRMSTVESVFANIEYNKGLKRFSLRGKKKVQAQWQLFSVVHNIEKWSPRMSYWRRSIERNGCNEADFSIKDRANPEFGHFWDRVWICWILWRLFRIWWINTFRKYFFYSFVIF